MYNEKWITNRWRRFYEGESESYSPEVHYSSTTKYRLLSTMDAWIFFVDGRFHNESQWLVRNQSFLFQSNSLRILQRELCQADRLVQSRQTPQRKGFFNWTTRMSRFIKDAGFVFSYWVCLFFLHVFCGLGEAAALFLVIHIYSTSVITINSRTGQAFRPPHVSCRTPASFQSGWTLWPCLDRVQLRRTF